MIHMPCAVKQVHKMQPIFLFLRLVDSEAMKVFFLLIIAVVELCNLVDVAFAQGLQLVKLV